MEDTIKIELLTPLTGTFLPNEMEQDWEEEDYNDFEEEQVFFEGDDLTEYASVIQEKIAEYNRVGHDDDRTDNLMDYFDGSAAIKEKVSFNESQGFLPLCIFRLLFQKFSENQIQKFGLDDIFYLMKPDKHHLDRYAVL